ncbi:MAG: GNAT family N-acetyltransferase [Leptolyngbya sp. SIO1D8]|nr:GNAT family N-acetyltransferase [Leptolyngbya sp. SIO1D8]
MAPYLTDETFTYRLLSTKDVFAVSELVARVFNEFVAPEYASEGVQAFHRYIQPSAFRARAQANHFSLITLKQDKVVGVIEMRCHNHVSLLFVAPAFQHQGIAKELLRRALQICRANEPALSEISVNSSSYAVPIYEKLGFRQAGEKQVRNGIGFFPMVLQLPDYPTSSPV